MPMPEPNRIAHQDWPGPAPLSFAQRQLWFLDRLAPGNPFYTELSVFPFRLALDHATLERSLNEIVRRHEILRTTFQEIDGNPVQLVAPELVLKLGSLDLRHLPHGEREPASLEILAREARRSFDLQHLPLLHATALRLDDEAYVLAVAMHHIITDGWSLQVFGRELSALYSVFAAGGESPLPLLPIQYRDYAVWQNERLHRGEVSRLLEFWRERLHGIVDLQLYTDHPRPAEPSYRGARREFSVPGPVRERLRSLCRDADVTLYMLLLAGFQLLLHRYSGQTDIVIGSPVANRPVEELEGLIGFFVNTVVIRVRLDGNPTFRDLLARVRDATLDAFAHQELPFELLVEELRPQRDASRNPLFQIMFQVGHSQGSNGQAKLPGTAGASLGEVQRGSAKFDLELDFWDDGRHLRGRMGYSADLFDAPTIQRMIGHLLTLLAAASAAPDQEIAAIPLLAESERRQLLGTWAHSHVHCPVDRSVVEHFAEQARATPTAVAVTFGSRKLTYAELAARSNQIAQLIRSTGTQPRSIIGFCAVRSIDVVATMLGILKAGCAYLPLDPEEPPQRLERLAQRAKLRLVLTWESQLSFLQGAVDRVICLSTGAAELSQCSSADLGLRVAADDLAYVLFTSGSSGEPKATCIPHRGIVRLVKGADYLALGPSTVFLQAAPLSFDAATLEIWGPLLNGGRVVLIPSASGATVEQIAGTIESFGVTAAWVTAGLLPGLVDGELSRLRQLRCLLTGGDVPSVQHVAKLVDGWDGTACNGYGPTETTTFATIHQFGPAPLSAPVAIGRPVANTSVYVVDDELRLVPPGAVGELLIGGDGLARGYLDDPAGTAERFLPHPFAKSPGERVYRTGDLVRFLPTGQLQFLSRLDQQLKICGYRVEPAEIERALREYPGIRDAVVIAAGADAETKHLVAYVGAPHEVRTAELRRHLQGRLPRYLIPSRFVALPALPLLANGKLDRSKLAALCSAASAAPEAAPASELEQAISSIWQEVLGVDQVDVDDNFFEAGGQSLLLIRVHSKLQLRLGRSIALVDLFHFPTVRTLAERLALPTTDQPKEAAHDRGDKQRRALARRQRPGRARLSE